MSDPYIRDDRWYTQQAADGANYDKYVGTSTPPYAVNVEGLDTQTKIEGTSPPEFPFENLIPAMVVQLKFGSRLGGNRLGGYNHHIPTLYPVYIRFIDMATFPFFMLHVGGAVLAYVRAARFINAGQSKNNATLSCGAIFEFNSVTVTECKILGPDDFDVLLSPENIKVTAIKYANEGSGGTVVEIGRQVTTYDAGKCEWTWQ
ncbi:MAG: hypothetical protein LBR78_02760 [Holosporales bacterium]|jgi:hypothetical protein|nr:hypothetical protein [Holosporales bacterium]